MRIAPSVTVTHGVEPKPLPLVPMALAMLAIAAVAGYFAYGLGRDVASGAADAVAAPTALAARPVSVATTRAGNAALAEAVGSEPVSTPAAATAVPAPISAAAVADSQPIAVATAAAPVGGVIGQAAPPDATNATRNAGASSALAPPNAQPAPAGVAAGQPAIVSAPAAQGTGALQTSQAIKLGQPLKLAGSADTLVLLATNATGRPLAVNVRAEIDRAGSVVATATGGVPVLLGGQTRVVNLKSDKPLPSTFDSARLFVDSIGDPPPGADAGPIKLDAPKLTRPSPPTAEVVATNTSAQPHAFTVQAAFAQGDRLVGLVSAPVGQLAAGQSHTVALASGAGTADAVYAVVAAVRD